MQLPLLKKRTRKDGSLLETLVFLLPLLIFLALLYGTLIWTVYVSFTNWNTIAPNYDFSGLKWYRFLVAQPRFEVDIRNNLLWLLLGVIPTVAVAILLAYFLELTPYPKVEAYIRTFLMGTFFLGVPRELEEAAKVDGASRLQTFFRIITPISLPAYASVAIIIFTQVWNEFFLALTLASRRTQTVQVVMAEAKGTTLVLYNLQMAAALIAVAIPMLLFLFMGRYFVRGILAGAMKG